MENNEAEEAYAVFREDKDLPTIEELDTLIRDTLQGRDLANVTRRMLYDEIGEKLNQPLEKAPELKRVVKIIANRYSAERSAEKTAARTNPPAPRTTPRGTTQRTTTQRTRGRAKGRGGSTAGGAAITSSKTQQLRKIVSDLRLGPGLYRGLPSDTDAYNETLTERIIERCMSSGIISERRLPTTSEISAIVNRRQRDRDLEGLDTSNIIEETRRLRPRKTQPKKSPEVSSSEESYSSSSGSASASGSVSGSASGSASGSDDEKNETAANKSDDGSVEATAAAPSSDDEAEPESESDDGSPPRKKPKRNPQ